MSSRLKQQVRLRAKDSCEYCQLAQVDTILPHEIDHIRARKHGGKGDMENLCLACAYCNAAKGPNIAGRDPLTDELVPLFDPRSQKWEEHFHWRGPLLVGKTGIGRTTIDLLRINAMERVEHRRLLRQVF